MSAIFDREPEVDASPLAALCKSLGVNTRLVHDLVIMNLFFGGITEEKALEIKRATNEINWAIEKLRELGL